MGLAAIVSIQVNFYRISIIIGTKPGGKPWVINHGSQMSALYK